MDKVRKIPVRAYVFLLLALVMILLLNWFLQPIWPGYNNFAGVHGFYEDPDNTVETVFLGPSTMLDGIVPMHLYEEYGMCAYNMAISQGPMISSYYWLEEVWRKHPQSLENVILEVSTLRSSTTSPLFHKAMDGMKLSKVKYQAYYDFYGGHKEAIQQLIPLYSWHDRWSEISKTDFTKLTREKVNGTRGYYFLTNTQVNEKGLSSIAIPDAVLDTSTEREELLEDSIYWFTQIVQFCEEKGLDLTLMKFPATNWSQGYHMAVEDLLVEMGLELPFFDFNYQPYFDELEYCRPVDNSDSGHLNYYSALKMTEWFGKYLSENCTVTDVRGDADFAFMEEQLKMYERTVETVAKLRSATTLSEYLSTASRQGLTVLMAVRDDGAAELTDQERTAFEEMGLSKLAQLGFRDSYYAVIEEGEVLVEELDADGTSAISKKGTLADGTSYRIKSAGKGKGTTASILVDGAEKAKNTRGINLVVYDHIKGAVADTAVFDTSTGSLRNAYDPAVMQQVLDGTADEEVLQLGIYKDTLAFLSRFEDETIYDEKIGEDLGEFLKGYWGLEDRVIFLAVKGDGASVLEDRDRTALAWLDLPQLATLKEGESYLGYIDEGQVKYDLRSGDETLVIDELGCHLESTGDKVGESAAQIIIGEEDFAGRADGLYIAVYNKRTKRTTTAAVLKD